MQYLERKDKKDISNLTNEISIINTNLRCNYKSKRNYHEMNHDLRYMSNRRDFGLQWKNKYGMDFGLQWKNKDEMDFGLQRKNKDEILGRVKVCTGKRRSSRPAIQTYVRQSHDIYTYIPMFTT